MSNVSIFCLNCTSEFQRRTSEVNYSLKRNPLYKPYCSNKCKIEGSSSKVIVSCVECKKEVYKQQKDIKKGGNLFCTKTCSSIYNNKKYPKRKGIKSGFCDMCNNIIDYKLSSNGKCYNKRKFCDGCFEQKKHLATDLFLSKTKGDFFKNISNYTYARSKITKHSKKTYDNSNRIKECAECGYDKYYEVCHIQSVSSFDNDVLVSVINDLNNLVSLCPNHHWEFDNGFLSFKKEWLR